MVFPITAVHPITFPYGDQYSPEMRSAASSPAPSYEKTSAMLDARALPTPQQKTSLLSKILPGRRAKAAGQVEAFSPTRPAPLALLAPEEAIDVRVAKVSLSQVSTPSLKLVGGKKNKEVGMTTRVFVTVTATCCCGPKGKPVTSTKKRSCCCDSDNGSNAYTKADTVGRATVLATESAVNKGYEKALTWATADAVAVVQKKFAKQATKVLYG